MANKKNSTKVTPRENKITTIVALSVLGTIILIVLAVTLPGQIKYWTAEAQCGGKPYAVQIQSGFGPSNHGVYYKPGDPVSKSVWNSYYCTEREVSGNEYFRDALSL